MRASRLSAVMPALLTRMSIVGEVLRQLLEPRSANVSGCGDVERRAAGAAAAAARSPPPAPRASPRCAPRAPRGRPAPRARRAIASPIPCEAPVTSAVLPSSRNISVSSCASPAVQQLARAASGSAELAAHVDAGDDPLDRGRSSTRARPDLEEASRRRARCAMRSAPTRPSAPGRRSGAPGRRAPPSPVVDRRGVDVGHHRHARIAERASRRGAAVMPSRAGRHQRRVERARRPAAAVRLARPRSLASATARSTAARVAGDHGLPGRVVVGHGADLAVAASAAAATARDRLGVEAEDRGHRARRPTGTASCISSPRRRTRRRASAKSRAPAATRAEYSPRLCPATATGRTLAARPSSARWIAIEAARSAGCVLAVSCSSSSGPSQQSRESGEAERRRRPRRRPRRAASSRRPRRGPCRPSASPGRGRRSDRPAVETLIRPDLGDRRRAARLLRCAARRSCRGSCGASSAARELDGAADGVLDGPGVRAAVADEAAAVDARAAARRRTRCSRCAAGSASNAGLASRYAQPWCASVRPSPRAACATIISASDSALLSITLPTKPSQTIDVDRCR